ncbi:hypothetical protein D3C81_1969130 [compost metagenome]
MGGDDAHDRQAFQLRCEYAFPGGTGGVVRDAAIDDGPAAHSATFAFEFIGQQPEIDVVEGEGQAHAQPLHAGHNLERAANVWQRVVKWIG